MPTPLNVVVTGASGTQGRHVVRALLARGHHVRAVTRNASTPHAQALQHARVELFEGSWDDETSMNHAMRGMNALVLHTVPWWVGAPREHELAARVAKAAKDANINNTVFISAAGALDDSGFVVLESKGRIERLLDEMALPHAVVAPAFLMENFLAPLWFGGIADGTFPIPLPATRTLQLVSARDQAVLVAHLLENASAHQGQRFPIAADELSCAEIASVLSRHCGRTVTHQLFPLEQVEAINPALSFLFKWLDEKGHGVDVEKTRAALGMVPWQRFDAWAAAQEWSILDAPPVVTGHDHDHDHTDQHS